MVTKREVQVATIDLTTDASAFSQRGSSSAKHARAPVEHTSTSSVHEHPHKTVQHPNSNTHTHVWEPQERLILIMLREYLENDWAHLVRLFNAIFKHNVPTTGLTKQVLKAQYASITRDPRHRMDIQQLWDLVLGSSKPMLTSEKEGLALIEDTAFKTGVRLIVKRKSTQPTATDPSLKVNTTKRSFEAPFFESTPPPPKRWSGLGLWRSGVSQPSASGLRTPPDSIKKCGHGGYFQTRMTGSPIRRIEQKRSTTANSLTFRSSPEFLSATITSETGSLYVPSTSSVTEFCDEETIRPTPTLSPEWDTEADFFSANSMISSTEDEDGDDRSLQVSPMSGQIKNTKKASKYLAGSTDQIDLPLLGYRAFSNLSHGYNTGHHFVSGLHKDLHTIPPCPPVDNDFYISEAEKHVGKAPRPTPFISLSSTPLRALMLAFGFRRRKSCTGSYLAVIDLGVLRRGGVIQKAKDLNLRPLRTYFPANEYLVWGEIKSEAIISVIDIADLIESPPHHPYDDDPLALREIATHWKAWYAWKLIKNINRNNQVFLSCCMGYAVGQFPRILGLPERCLESAVEGIVHDWGLSCSKHECWKDNEIFCEFVKKGYNGTDISHSSLDTTSRMTISVKEEQIDPLPAQLPVVILSDDEGGDEACSGDPIHDPNKAAADVMDIDHKDNPRSYKPHTNEPFAALPACYENEKESDSIEERHHLESQCRVLFALLPRAYEAEMRQLE